MNILIIALAPVIVFLSFIYFKDKYDKEPLGLLAKLFFLGFFAVIPITIVELMLSAQPLSGPFYEAFVVAGLTEECFKFGIALIWAYRSVHFDQKLDGIVYCVFISLGFAACENIMYVLGNGNTYMYVGIVRALSSIPVHLLLGVAMGYYFSLAKFAKTPKEENENLVKAISIPVLFHGFYDYILMSQMYGYFMLFLAFLIFLWVFNMKKLNEYTKEAEVEHFQALDNNNQE